MNMRTMPHFSKEQRRDSPGVRKYTAKKWMVITKWVVDHKGLSLVGFVVRNPSANECDAKMQVQSLSQEGLLEEREMASHSSIVACEIPWMEKPGRLQSMGCRVGHNLVIKSQKQVEFPPKQTLKQEFKCKSFIWEMILGRTCYGKRK